MMLDCYNPPHRFVLLSLPMIKYDKDYLERNCEDCYCCCLNLLSHLGIGGHDDRLTKLFGSE